jgi:hypothetical protein
MRVAAQAAHIVGKAVVIVVVGRRRWRRRTLRTTTKMSTTELLLLLPPLTAMALRPDSSALARLLSGRRRSEATNETSCMQQRRDFPMNTLTKALAPPPPPQPSTQTQTTYEGNSETRPWSQLGRQKRPFPLPKPSFFTRGFGPCKSVICKKRSKFFNAFLKKTNAAPCHLENNQKTKTKTKQCI